MGLRVREAERLDSFVRDFLGPTPQQITSQQQAALAGMLNSEYLPSVLAAVQIRV
jgi:hypothetical protein